MPPKVKISCEDIIKTAVLIVKTGGVNELNARNIATKLGCSTQPIFSNFQTMDELKGEVVCEVEKIYQQYVANGAYVSYKEKAMAYISFAKQEKNLFKLLFLEEGQSDFLNGEPLQALCMDTGLSGDTAQLFNLEMWAFVHGMAVMTANASFPLHDTVISRIFDDAYQGLKTRFNLR